MVMAGSEPGQSVAAGLPWQRWLAPAARGCRKGKGWERERDIYAPRSPWKQLVSVPRAHFRTVMAEYSALLSDLTELITGEDVEQLKSACKEDLPEDQSAHITCSKDWFCYLEKNHKLAQDNLSYIEHIFEISRRPDLLTRVIEYRTTVLKISEDDEIDSKLTRIPSAKKYKDIIRQPSEDEIIKLAPPPKKV
ncbi:hypothetical protein AAFF_G00353720 [Aldrovandia affinis]|uniref:Astrocytic phosphoprotein PEA-15 n=1 Tax=Aldrovandia affinis TaxID=143900 RepID=A0AAD7R570_9TELE|nr:hypothetical protein AAFF_G00353720 [Aldrovandia affinis]